MKAIVLTCDKYRKLTDHMIFKYDQLWPDHPFEFRVPYQEAAEEIASGKVEYIQTSPNIKSCVLELLQDLDDEQFIYWCMDDKYPVYLNTDKLDEIYKWINSASPPEMDGLLFCRCRSMWNRKNLRLNKLNDSYGEKIFERINYKQIWLHQFIKVKVLRYLFNSFPDQIASAKLMDSLKKKLVKPESHRLFVTKRNFAVFGESTSRGVLTRNCYKSFVENRLALPEWYAGRTVESIFFGATLDNYERRVRNFFKTLTA